MWFIFKIFVILASFFIRLVGHFLSYKTGKRIKVNGVICYVSETFKKEVWKIAEKNITTVSIPLNCSAIFKLTKETVFDRFFKALGFTSEFQTGDREFDRHIYIASDSFSFQEKIKNDLKIRNNVTAIFKEAARNTNISCDGKTLRFYFEKVVHIEEMLPLCVTFYKRLSVLEKEQKSFFSDAFALKILLVEAFIWSLASYAAISSIEWCIFQQDVHLSIFPIILRGIILGFVVFFIIFIFIFLFLRGSSRGHRTLVESLLVLGLSLPVGGIGVICDINTQMDKSVPVAIHAKILSLQTKEHRSRRGGRSYSYHIAIQPVSKNKYLLKQSKSLEIGSDLYKSLEQSDYVKIQIKEGYLGYPWYESITPE